MLDVVQFSYNLQKRESIGISTLELAMGQQPLAPYDLLVPYKGKSPGAFRFAKAWREKLELAKASLAKAARKMKKWVDLKRRHREFEEGDLIMVKLILQTIRNFKKAHKGLLRRYEGPFSVEKWIGKLAHQVKLLPYLECHLVFHVSFLKSYYLDKGDPRRNKSQRLQQQFS